MITIEHESMSGAFSKIHVRDAPSHFILHEFHDTDEGDPHDHPFDIEVTILKGGYVDFRYDVTNGDADRIERHVGDTFTIHACAVHRIVGLLHGPCLTLATYGPWVQEPGFWRFDHGGAMRRQHNSSEWVRMPHRIAQEG